MEQSQNRWWRRRIVEHLGVSMTTANELVEFTQDLSCWMLSATPDVRVIRVPVGPAFAGSTGLLLRAGPGVVIAHELIDTEARVLVLQGSLRDEAGRTASAGEFVVSAPGSGGRLAVVEPHECICVVLSRHRA